MTNLFQRGSFILASGKASHFKIECDALTNEDWETLAMLIAERCSPFGTVEGIPTGGIKLANALRKYSSSNSSLRLLVDDVYSTGQSLGKMRKRNDEVWVVFARKKPTPTSGVNALFIME